MENKRVKVWDLAVRLGHWAMGGLVLAAFLTTEDDASTPLHTRLGLALLGLVVFRVVWGFVGSTHARFTDFVRSPQQVLTYVRAYVKGRPPGHVGHNPLGALMVVTLLATVLVVTLTGLFTALGPEFGGPLSALLSKDGAHAVKEVHEAAAWLLPVLVVFHVAGVVLSSFLEKQNLVAGMVTGFKRAPDAAPLQGEPTLFARTLGFIAAAGLALAVVMLLWRIMPIGEAEAAAPRGAVFEKYSAEARATVPAFAADAARGKTLYFEAHDRNGTPTSCATCHTDDPRTQGRSPVGKRIEPLSPSANPDRFTDPVKTERWFERNCKQVLGRVCSPAEKADFISYVSSL